MKLINGSLTVLVFINAVYSAAIRDAFEMNLPPEHTEPTQLSEIELATEKTLDPVHPTDPTADFPNTTSVPNLVEPADVAEERSIESSNSDSRLAGRASTEESREGYNYKRSQQIRTLTDTHKALQEHYVNSAESMNIDSTDMDAGLTESSDKHIDKATVKEDISSQEMDRPEENERNRPKRIQKMLEIRSTAVTDKDFMKEIHPIISFASRMNLKDQAGKQRDTDKRAMDLDSPEFVDTPDRPDLYADSEERFCGRSQIQIPGIEAKLNYIANRATLDASREVADLIPGCTETSVEHPMEENNSLDAPNVDQEIQKDTMSYRSQLRKMCPTKSGQASNNPRAQILIDDISISIDIDSPESVNSEVLDRDNSSERLEDHVAVPL